METLSVFQVWKMAGVEGIIRRWKNRIKDIPCPEGSYYPFLPKTVTEALSSLSNITVNDVWNLQWVHEIPPAPAQFRYLVAPRHHTFEMLDQLHKLIISQPLLQVVDLLDWDIDIEMMQAWLSQNPKLFIVTRNRDWPDHIKLIKPSKLRLRVIYLSLINKNQSVYPDERLINDIDGDRVFFVHVTFQERIHPITVYITHAIPGDLDDLSLEEED